MSLELAEAPVIAPAAPLACRPTVPAQPAGVLAFTVGAHSCMGAHLARLEIKIALQEWLKRIPTFSVAPDFKAEYRPGGVVGPEEVPLTW